MEEIFTGRIRLKPLKRIFGGSVLVLQLERAYDWPVNDGNQVQIERKYRWVYAKPEYLLNSNDFDLFKKLLEKD
jgi:hypothetical protein